MVQTSLARLSASATIKCKLSKAAPISNYKNFTLFKFTCWSATWKGEASVASSCVLEARSTYKKLAVHACNCLFFSSSVKSALGKGIKSVEQPLIESL